MSGPGAMSRYLFATASEVDGVAELGDVEPYGYRVHADTVEHVVAEGDSLFTLAGRYYADVPRGCGLWWAIADFQPEPIVDATLALTVGSTIHIPSERVVLNEILGEGRRRTA